MAVEFNIIWDGDAPGLADGHLSLGHFAEALYFLVKGVQTTASQILANALDEPSYGAHRRHADAAKVDVVVQSLDHNCLALETVCVYRADIGETIKLFGLEEQAMVEFTRAIDAERKGEIKSASARRFLKALPEGLVRQRYVVRNGNGTILASTDFGSYEVAATPLPAHHVARCVGQVASINLESDRESISLRFDGRKQTMRATRAQIVQAWDLHDSMVEVSALVHPEGARVLWLRAATDPFMPKSPSERTKDHLSHWKVLLERLA